MRRRLIIGVLIALGLALVTRFLVQGANRPADPYFRSAISGFGEQSFSIEAKAEPGSGSLRCALVAATEAQLSRGLMGRRELGGYDGMIFRFASEGLRPFTMRGTLIPLSIAWFDADGILVDRAEMTPCPERLSCPDYASDKPYQYALETQRGGLKALGVAPGAHLALGGSCS